MNLLISISGLFFLRLTLLELSSIAEHKLVTASLVQGLFSFLLVSLAHSACLSETGCYLGNAVFKCVKSFCG